MHYSPEQFHLRVPRDRALNLRWRLYVLRRCREKKSFRRAVEQMCRSDILFWINTFVWQFNPNSIGKNSVTVGPFVTWGFQDRSVRTILDCIEDRSDLVIEKSREMGASWLCLIVMLWFWIYHPMSKFLCISRNEDAVDLADDADSLFWKLDFMLRHMPEWMVPRHSRRVKSFHNLENGAQITGQASTGKAGVGGRALAMFVDEFSQIREDWEVYDRTSDTSGCRIFNGTHKGTNTCFFELTRKSEQAGHTLRKLVMHWSDHPDKNGGLYHWDARSQQVEYHDPSFRYPRGWAPVTDGSPTGGPRPGLRSPWYDAACSRKGSARAVAADLDINPTGSTEQLFDPLMVNSLVDLYSRDPDHECDLEWIRETADPVRLHDHQGGTIKLWCRLDKDGRPPRGRYAFGCDIAAGTGATPSCLSGADVVTGQKVLEYSNPHIEPKEFAYLSVAICRLFRDQDGLDPRLAWEVPGPGTIFGKHVLALGYRNVHFRTTEHRMKKEVSDTPGWANSPDTMLSLILSYRDALRAKKFLNPSRAALKECLSFVYGPDGYVFHTGAKDPKDASGARINHGDHVVADALCWKMLDTLGRLSGAETVSTRPRTDPREPLAVGLALRRMMSQREVSDNHWVD